MIRLLKYFLTLVFAGFNGVMFSQNEAAKWYFGNHAALDFSTNPPGNLANGATSTPRGCSSIANASGNLLFYTNGVTVWNQAHQVMANGTGLPGNSASSQGALIVKQPGSSTIYYVFTTDGGANGLCYSVVDMSLAAGMGSVTTKNQPVFASSTERLCGTKHCNGTDIWVISHDRFSNNFRANLVTAAGVNTVAVLSAIGTVMNSANSAACMKVSPNGRKLGTALYSPASFELYDFNSLTGVVSNSLSLPVSAAGYGCEFSPDGTKFYGSLLGETNMTYRLRQWDLCAGSDQAIIASASSYNATHSGQLQLAPDGKIYQARATVSRIKISPEASIDVSYGESVLGVIHNPNASAAALNFNNTGQSVSPGTSMFGLPNFVSGFYKTTGALFSFSLNPAVNCTKAFFTAPPLINATCSATSYTVNTVKWLFGDPASGPANTSTIVNADHQYPNIGTYQVRLILYNDCGGVIDSITQSVAIGSALLNTPSSFSLCVGQSLTLSAAGSSTYSWSTGATANSIVVTPTSNTTYSLSFTDSFGCQYQSVQTVTVKPIPSFTVSGKDTVCEGSVVVLKAGGAVTYSWSTGSTNSTISVTPATTTAYTLTGGGINGCTVDKIKTVYIKPAPIPVIVANTLVCEGASATAVAQGNDAFTWNNGTIGPTLTVFPDRELGFIFSVKATYTNSCIRYQRVRFNIHYPPRMTIAGSNTLCLGGAVTQTVSGALSYSWSTGPNTNTIYLAPSTTSTYTVSGTGTNICVGTETLILKVNPSSPANAFVSDDVTICNGESAMLSAAGGEDYDWKPTPVLVKPGRNRVMVNPAVSTIYSVTISTDSACASTKTVMVHVKPNPGLWAGRDTVFNPDDLMILTASGTGTFSWTGTDGTGCKDCRSLQIFPDQRTCYLVEAINEFGCAAADEICVDVGPGHTVYVPDAFTPNGDGLNDEWLVSGLRISELRLSVFDRWGERLFMSNNQLEGWNGRYKGQLCPAGNYNWIMEYVLEDGQRLKKTGRVSLQR